MTHSQILHHNVTQMTSSPIPIVFHSLLNPMKSVCTVHLSIDSEWSSELSEEWIIKLCLQYAPNASSTIWWPNDQTLERVLAISDPNYSRHHFKKSCIRSTIPLMRTWNSLALLMNYKLDWQNSPKKKRRKKEKKKITKTSFNHLSHSDIMSC